MVFEHRSLTTIGSRRWQEAVQLTLCSETHVVGCSKGLGLGIVGFALGVSAESRREILLFHILVIVLRSSVIDFYQRFVFPNTWQTCS